MFVPLSLVAVIDAAQMLEADELQTSVRFVRSESLSVTVTVRFVDRPSPNLRSANRVNEGPSFTLVTMSAKELVNELTPLFAVPPVSFITTVTRLVPT